MRLVRTHIARELHDDVGQALTGLKLDVAWLKRRIDAIDVRDQALTQRLTEMTQHLDGCLASVRDLSADLRNGPRDPSHLHMEIEDYIRQLARRGGLKLFADIEPISTLDGCAAIHLFRLIQEALTNVVRHANATAVWIHLAQIGDDIELRIRDDGVGMAKDACTQSSSGGITGMHERIQLLKGQLAITPASQGGTLVNATIPCRFGTSKTSSAFSTSQGN